MLQFCRNPMGEEGGAVRGGGGGRGVRGTDLGALVNQCKFLLPVHCFSTVVYHCVISYVTVYYYSRGSSFEMVYMYMYICNVCFIIMYMDA